MHNGVDLFYLLNAITLEAMFQKQSTSKTRRGYASAIGLPAAVGDLSKKKRK